MTKRYATTGGQFFTEWGAGTTAQVVIVEDDKIKQTGLVDRFGVPICSYEEKRPPGFYALRERDEK